MSHSSTRPTTPSGAGTSVPERGSPAVAYADDRVVIGEVRHHTATGVVTVRQALGVEADLPADGRIHAVGALDRIPQLPLHLPADPATAVDHLLDALHVEPEKGTQ